MTDQTSAVAVLGSTGSIGRQTLQVLGWHSQRFRAAVLAAATDSEAFREQVWTYRPRLAVVRTAHQRDWVPTGTEIMVGADAFVDAVTRPEVTMVVVATSGLVSLRPTMAALRAGKVVAVANKEVLVSAGHLVIAAAREYGASIRPIDSEHSAIWQCLGGEAWRGTHETVRRIILTASGGAFRDWSTEQLADATPAAALQHPNWAMGPKITVDSATLMNKGLEAIEASWLFDQPLSAIEIMVHRESVIHSLVEFIDRSVKAQLATADMRLPIQYALAYPDRLTTPTASLDLLALGSLTFEPLDRARFPSPGLAYEAARRGQTYPAVLNAANEEAVRLFLKGELAFGRIPTAVESALEAHVPVRDPELAAVEEADTWARAFVRKMFLWRGAGVMISPSTGRDRPL